MGLWNFGGVTCSDKHTELPKSSSGPCKIHVAEPPADPGTRAIAQCLGSQMIDLEGGHFDDELLKLVNCGKVAKNS